MESGSRKRFRRTKLQDAILSTLEVGGVLAVAVIAPNLLQLLKKHYTDRSIRSAAQRLVDKGLLAFEKKSGRIFMRLTKKGAAFVHRSKTLVQIPKHWDGKWRLVIFDIAEVRRSYRVLLRRTLAEIGFKRLQDSVWVFPYNCEELILLLKADFGLGKEVLYIIADTIERDADVRAHFKLK